MTEDLFERLARRALGGHGTVRSASLGVPEFLGAEVVEEQAPVETPQPSITISQVTEVSQPSSAEALPPIATLAAPNGASPPPETIVSPTPDEADVRPEPASAPVAPSPASQISPIPVTKTVVRQHATSQHDHTHEIVREVVARPAPSATPATAVQPPMPTRTPAAEAPPSIEIRIGRLEIGDARTVRRPPPPPTPERQPNPTPRALALADYLAERDRR